MKLKVHKIENSSMPDLLIYNCSIVTTEAKVIVIIIIKTTMVATPILLQQPDAFNVNRDKDAPIATFQL